MQRNQKVAWEVLQNFDALILNDPVFGLGVYEAKDQKRTSVNKQGPAFKTELATAYGIPFSVTKETMTVEE